jgi:type I restriction enzyme S subunit
MKQERLRNIASFINGAAFKPEDWNDKGLKIIRIQNLTNPNKPYNKTLRKVDDKYIVKKGDVLVSWSATIDVFTWENDEEALLNQHIFKVIFDFSKVEKRYFIFALKQTIDELTKFAHGSTMKHVVKKDFDNHQIFLPSLQDQIRIAEILTQAESLIVQRKESITLLDELLKSTFLEMFGSVLNNLKKFNIVKIEDISTAIKDGPHTSPKYTEGGIPILSTRNIRPGKVSFEDVKYVSLETYTFLTRNFKPSINDVIVTKGGTTGFAKVVDFDFPFCIWVHLAIIRPNIRINPIYLEHFINSDYGYFQTQKYTRGIANRDLGLTRIAKIELLLPPLALQNKFATIVEKVEVLKSEYQASFTELENMYGVLSQKAFKGEMKVNEYSNNEKLGMVAEKKAEY